MPRYISQSTLKRKIQAFCTDVFIWSYTFIILHKIVYQKIILGMRFAEFSWSEPLYASALAFVIAALLFSTNLSIGRMAFALNSSDENQPLLAKPFAVFGLFVILLTFIAGIFITQVSLREFFSPPGLQGAKRIFGALLSPTLTYLKMLSLPPLKPFIWPLSPPV